MVWEFSASAIRQGEAETDRQRQPERCPWHGRPEIPADGSLALEFSKDAGRGRESETHTQRKGHA